MSTSSTGQSRSLQRTEAEARRALLAVRSYDVALDLSGADASDATTYGSRTTIVLDSAGGATFLDVKPAVLGSVSLDGRALDVSALQEGRFPLDLPAGAHEVVVEARMRWRRDGEGLHRSVDPADGRVYVYGMCFMDAAPSVFACFDQPDLKAPYTVHVQAPTDWVVVGNGRAEQVEPGRWELATTPPLSTYFVTLVAGPYHVLREEHDGIALGLSARRSLAGALDREAEELFTLTRRCLDELHRLFGIRYAFGDYHQAFVPEFNAGAMENPGCVTFRDQMVFDSRVTRAARIDRATTIAHEMAHQWFGDLVTPRWWDDLWLNESFAEYLGTRVTADATTYDDAWAHQASRRRQWGLVADQRSSTHPVAGNGAEDAVGALQDFDGISYAKGSAVLKQLVARIGDETFLAGVVDHLTRHRFGNATMADLVASWERAGAGDLGGFVAQWLRTPGLDTLGVDRAAGAVRREPPRGPGADVVRDHALSLAVPDGAGGWRRHPLEVADALTPLPDALADEVRAAAAVVLDPDEQTWAAACADPATVEALTGLLPALAEGPADPALEAAVWNNVRSAYRLARLDPALVVDLVVAAPPLGDLGDTATGAVPWTVGALLPAAPAGSTARVHAALLDRLEAAAADDDLLRAARGVVHTAEDPSLLRRWLGGGAPDGLVLDDDLRWRLWTRLATLGGTDRAELDDALAAAPSSTGRVEHVRAVASLPDAEAKQWAWDRFVSGDEHGNYEVLAAGGGLWRPGQQALTAGFVERYVADLPGTARRRSGWSLADAAAAFFPLTHVEQATLDAVAPLLDDADVPGAVRRQVADACDDLARALEVRRAFPVPAVQDAP